MIQSLTSFLGLTISCHCMCSLSLSVCDSKFVLVFHPHLHQNMAHGSRRGPHQLRLWLKLYYSMPGSCLRLCLRKYRIVSEHLLEIYVNSLPRIFSQVAFLLLSCFGFNNCPFKKEHSSSKFFLMFSFMIWMDSNTLFPLSLLSCLGTFSINLTNLILLILSSIYTLLLQTNQ